MKTEQILHNNNLFALIIYQGQAEKGVQFFTPDDYSLQVGKHDYLKGKVIKPHQHLPVKVERTGSLQEVLYIEEGIVKVLFYSEDGHNIDSKILTKGDMILLMDGGHGFEFLETTKMIEIKQGPYMPESKKSLRVE